MDWVFDSTIWTSLAALTVMEIVLGIDNVVFLSLIAGRLPGPAARRARQYGLALALIARLAMLGGIVWLVGLTRPVIEVAGQALSWRDLVLLSGGLFLIAKATHEIHNSVEGAGEAAGGAPAGSFIAVVAQIAVIDMVFSVDSVITAVGMAEHFGVMAAAVVIAIAVMYAASGPVSDFLKQHPTTKMLALGFLFLIGVALIGDGLGFHIPRGYIYFAMAFSGMIEGLNVFAARRRARR
jgi:predicted tellurium resistance membrane protein TerC